MDSTGVPAGGSTDVGNGAGAGGLRLRLNGALVVLSSLVSELEPARLAGADARDLYASFAKVERLAMAAKALLAPRVDESGIWKDEGHRDASTHLAALEGIPTGQARSTLELGQALGELPGTEEAIRAGRLSRQKATELAGAASLDPSNEDTLLKGAEEEPFFSFRDRCRRARATSSQADPMAAVRKAHRDRSFTSWNDADGTFHYKGSDTPDRGAKIQAAVDAAATAIRKEAKRAGTEEATEPHRALCADGFFALVTRGGDTGVGGRGSGDTAPRGMSSGSGGSAKRTGSGADAALRAIDFDRDPEVEIESGNDPDDRCEDTGNGPTASEPLDLEAIVNRPPTCAVSVVVNLEALVRGSVELGERCEIVGVGPIPVPLARSMLTDSFLKFLVMDGEEIHSVSHMGRTINARLRTAIAYRDQARCVVPGCGARHRLEFDHVNPVNNLGATELDNLALLCHFHHHLKTNEAWELIREEGADRDRPVWRFVPPVAFGQEPDLGFDTEQARAARRRSGGAISREGDGTGSDRPLRFSPRG